MPVAPCVCHTRSMAEAVPPKQCEACSGIVDEVMVEGEGAKKKGYDGRKEWRKEGRGREQERKRRQG